MGVARAGHGRAVAAKRPKIIFKNFQFFSGGYSGFSQPAKTAYQYRDSIENGLKKSSGLYRWFWGVSQEDTGRTAYRKQEKEKLEIR